MPGDQVEFVALADGRLVEEGVHGRPRGFGRRPGWLGSARFRAMAVRRDKVWAVGGSAIEVLSSIRIPTVTISS